MFIIRLFLFFGGFSLIGTSVDMPPEDTIQAWGLFFLGILLIIMSLAGITVEKINYKK